MNATTMWWFKLKIIMTRLCDNSFLLASISVSQPSLKVRIWWGINKTHWGNSLAEASQNFTVPSACLGTQKRGRKRNDYSRRTPDDETSFCVLLSDNVRVRTLNPSLIKINQSGICNIKQPLKLESSKALQYDVKNWNIEQKNFDHHLEGFHRFS